MCLVLLAVTVEGPRMAVDGSVTLEAMFECCRRTQMTGALARVKPPFLDQLKLFPVRLAA
jgi:hypothetical protein